VRLDGATVWLSQRQIAELFQCSVPTINEHITHIFDEGELSSQATIRKFRIVQPEAAREVDFYSLDMIIAVGYRVKSARGTQFRIWATERLRELIVKGLVLDDERLKEIRATDYFDELLERIRDIRASERRFYQKITDIGRHRRFTADPEHEPGTTRRSRHTFAFSSLYMQTFRALRLASVEDIPSSTSQLTVVDPSSCSSPWPL